MKIKRNLLILLFLAGYCLQAMPQKVSLNMKQTTLEKVFSSITQQTKLSFVYSQPSIDPNKVVDIHVSELDLKEVFASLFKGTDIGFEITKKKIYLFKKESSSEKPAQQKQLYITGSVSDKNGEPLIGVTVSTREKTNGTLTDMDGVFSIQANVGNTLNFSYVGYKTQTAVINSDKRINIVLEEDARLIEEVVVVGYGVQNKRDVSTSISSIKSTAIENIPITDFRQAMSGKMAGVQVIQSSGDPEGKLTVRVRGVKSATAGNDPLYIIDGVPVERGFESINSNDIESIEVLKDASSAAIYGSRGSNGVILITTKQGKTEKTTVSYDGYYGLQKVSKKLKMLNAYQFAALVRDGHNAAYLDEYPNASIDDPNSSRPNGYQKIPEDYFPYLNGEPGLTDTDWQDEIFRTAPTVSHNLSLSGKKGSTTFFISAGYYKQDGVVICSDFERYTMRMNLASQTGKLKFGVNFTPTYSHSNKVNTSGTYGNDGVIQSALFMSPTLPVYNPDGSYNFDGNGYYRIGTDYQISEIINPVALANEIDNPVDRVALLGKVFGTFEFTENLSFTTTLGGDFYATNETYFRPSTLQIAGWEYYNKPSNPTSFNDSRFYYNWQIENNLSYNLTWGDHRLNAVAVYSAEKSTTKRSKVEGTDYPNDFIRTISKATVNDGSSSIDQWTLASWLGRVQYSYLGKYMFSAALRSDGSSRFGHNNRWGYFPSASAAWRISDEQFMQGAGFLDDLKLRASYGQTGNFQIGNYKHLASVSQDSYVLGPNDGKLITGYRPSEVENYDLGWEKTSMTNIGVDVSLFKGLLGFTIERYDSKTTDMLLEVPVPRITGNNTALMNIGEVSNKGWEFSVSSQKKIRDFNYSISGNIATNKNEVLKLGSENTPIIAKGSYSRAYYITQVGKPIGSYYLLVQDGIFSTTEELSQYPHFGTTQAGDFRFDDVDKDGVLDANKDRTIVGNYMPDFTYGFNGSVGYQNIDLSFAFQGVYGNEILNLNKRYLGNVEGNQNCTVDVLERWMSEENPGNGQINRANRKQKGNNGYTSTYHIEDGSYLRLQNLAIGYSFPAKLIKRANISKLRMYLSGSNLWTWTNYSGYNPEVSRRPDNALTPGEDYGTYPLAKTVTFGLNIIF